MPEHVQGGAHPRRPSQAELTLRLEECRGQIEALRAQIAKLVTICNRVAKDLPEHLAMQLRREVDDSRS